MNKLATKIRLFSHYTKGRRSSHFKRENRGTKRRKSRFYPMPGQRKKSGFKAEFLYKNEWSKIGADSSPKNLQSKERDLQ
ncbi:hypothetical protein HQ39_06830 [Porphyromonas sp. COT-108 OH2963]|nr:hypothetical protein HQ39_06830 [Porphyromonas sp. COT-108 OH2963]